ncbi:glutathione S-transferase E14 [Condylostylus longicornis]|uniref:glutathione S-transferase E14 n=1 Tax=Condylostylus longicornis TaxID=2530218 RepID=UPI00244DD746|nr:glutathione S-transferase E14 [Condylostylus longicornis]
MKPILYYDDRSPPVRSCLMLIDHLGIECELRYVDLFKGEQKSSDFLKINPVHTVPTLLDGEIVLRDSHTILIYLSEKYQNQNNCLYFSGRLEQLNIIDKMFFESSVLFRRDSDFMSEIIKMKLKNVDFEAHKRRILEVYSMLEIFLTETKYVASNKMTIADFSIVTTLSTVDLIFHVNDDWPYLFKWFEEMKKLSCYQKFNIPGLQKLKNALELFGDFKFPIE